MRLETEIEQIYRLGAEPVGLSVDSAERNAAMVRRWRLSFPIASDPNGERFLRPLGLWDEVDPRQIGIPAVLILTPTGEEILRFRSRDFADRPDDADIMAALADLGLPSLDPPPWEPAVGSEDHPSAFRTDAFGPCHRGVMFAMSALAQRMKNPDDRGEVEAMARQASSFLEAWTRIRRR